MTGIIRTRPGYEIVEYVQRVGNDSVYGNGSDGNVVVSNTGTPTVITRDMYYNSLTINSSCTFITNGFKVFVKDALTNNGTIGATVGYTTVISDGTVAGQSASVETYSLSQTSTNPVSLTLLHSIEMAITGYYVDNAGTVRQFRGGDVGPNGTGATSGGTGGAGAAGNAGTGANPGNAGADGLEAMQVRERQQVEPLGCLVTGITLMAVLVFITTGTALIMLPTMAMRALTAQDMEAVKVLLATQEMPGQTVQRVRLGIQEIQEMLVRMVLAVLAVLLY